VTFVRETGSYTVHHIAWLLCKTVTIAVFGYMLHGFCTRSWQLSCAETYRVASVREVGSYRVRKHIAWLLYEKLAAIVCGNISRGFCTRNWQLSCAEAYSVASVGETGSYRERK
jgi:hypothetical protein